MWVCYFILLVFIFLLNDKYKITFKCVILTILKNYHVWQVWIGMADFYAIFTVFID